MTTFRPIAVTALFTAFCFSLHSSAQSVPTSSGSTAQGPAYSVIQSTNFTPVVSPAVPRKITFAGKEFDFDRMDMYERLDRELSQMCYSHSVTMLMLKRANRYFPVIAPILKRNGVPDDLIYLA